MREIKFRAWDKEAKAMRYMDELGGICLDALNSSDMILEQSAGLKDRDGREIYEGDIIKTEKGNLQEVVSLIGKFNNKNMTSQFTCFYVGWENMNPSDVKGYYFSDTDEVVGNIHNNHELLEVQE